MRWSPMLLGIDVLVPAMRREIIDPVNPVPFFLPMVVVFVGGHIHEDVDVTAVLEVEPQLGTDGPQLERLLTHNDPTLRSCFAEPLQELG